MNLFIVESPSKAKTIKKYLGKDFEVVPTKGHVVDLPKSKLGVNVNENFAAQFEIKNQGVIDLIAKLSKKSRVIFLATDKDREGEAIAYNVLREVGLIDEHAKPLHSKEIKRIVFTEITKDAILEALKNPRSIDMNTVYSQYARRILDRLVGYTLSPLLWKKVAFGLSAGRVQSVALRILVDREEDRDNFKSEEYWSIQAKFTNEQKHKKEINLIIKLSEKKSEQYDNNELNFTEDDETFYLKSYGEKSVNLSNQDDAIKFVEIIKSKNYVVNDKNISITKRTPPFPLRTSTFQQAAVNKLGINAKKAMILAQKLYENGLITYMRTDSVFMSEKAVQEVRKLIIKDFGKEYVAKEQIQQKKQQKNNKFTQEAHECIRPVNIFKEGKDLKLTGQELSVYNLIRDYAIASQMADQVIQINTTEIKSTEGDLVFRNSKSKVVFPGYQIVFNSGNSSKKNNEQSIDFELKDEVFMTDVLLYQHFTNPPPRYTEASLIKKLEKEGIGRPSTYASIISIIQQRTYVEKQGKYFKPTDIGKVVISLLKKYFPYIVDLEFTADMENNLDMIESAKLDWLNFLKDFYTKFDNDLLLADKLISRADFTQLGVAPENIRCDICGSSMIIKLGRFGKFLSCSDYPKCKGIKQYTSMDISPESDGLKIHDIDLTKYKNPPTTENGVNYVLKKGKYGYFWAHPDYPKVKDIKQLEFSDEYLFEQLGDPPKTEDGKKYLLKKGKYGYFWAHPDYPNVKKIFKISNNIVL